MVKQRHVISASNPSASNPSASNPSASNQLNDVYDVRKGEYVYKHNMRRINPKLGANTKLGANNKQLEYNPANYGNGANYTAVSTSAAPQEQIENYVIKHFRTPSAGGRRRRKTRKQRRTIKRRNRKQ